ncbi:MAG: alpha-amylase family protein [Acidobacteriaceae bacterium]
MNRRDFMGTVVGGIAMAKLGAAPFYGLGAQAAAQGTKPPQGAWIENGVIDAGGSHEPYLFVVRRGGQSLNAREIYEYQQSEAVMRQLKNDGVEVFHTHLYKGFGMAAEKPDMEATVRATAIAHQLGMKVDTYVQWDTMMYETFFAEEPRAQGWIQCDQWGQPIMTEYGFQQSFRYRPCFSNQEYIDYLKKIVHYAVVEVKTDFIHFDNFDLSPEPDSCHCNGCKSGFRKFLKAKYSPEQRKERFGFENVDFVNPPLWNRSNPPEKLDIIFDPVFQEWIDYRCYTMADALGQMVDLIRPLNPEVAVEINFGGMVGDNNPWTRGNDHAKLLKLTQVFWDEQDAPLEYLPDGRLITTIRTYKMARTYHNVAFTDAEVGEPGIGESLAFNQTIGFAGENPLPPAMVKYISFYRKNRDLYLGTKDVAPVAVFRSHPSITYHNSRAGLSAILVEQALIQARVPFQLIFDEQLGDVSPTLCKVLILPDSECLTDDQLGLIRKFVTAGGGLIATEQAGLYDGWRRLRTKPGLLGLVDNQAPAAAYQEEVRNTLVAAGPPSRKQVGRGRVVYFPGIEFDGPLPPPEPYFHIGPKFWKRPKNSKELIEAVSWAAQSDLPLHVTGPDFLGANLVEQMEKRRRLVHLVNYAMKQVPSIENIEVRCLLPQGASAKAVRLYSIDLDNSATLDFRMQDGYAVFTVPKLNAYCMTAISW